MYRCVHYFLQSGVVPWNDLPPGSEVFSYPPKLQLVLPHHLVPPPFPCIFDLSLSLFLRVLAHLHHTYTRLSCCVVYSDAWALLVKPGQPFYPHFIASLLLPLHPLEPMWYLPLQLFLSAVLRPFACKFAWPFVLIFEGFPRTSVHGSSVFSNLVVCLPLQFVFARFQAGCQVLPPGFCRCDGQFLLGAERRAPCNIHVFEHEVLRSGDTSGLLAIS
jgi:hypothetical protein